MSGKKLLFYTFIERVTKSNGRVVGVWFVNRDRLRSQTKLDDTKFRYQLIITITISEKANAFFPWRAFNTNYPLLVKISVAEILSNVTILSILENPQFC